MSRVRINRNEERSARNQPRFEAERQWVYGMPGVAGRLVVSSPPVRGSAGTSDAATVLRAGMHPSMPRKRGHPIVASFEPGEDWFYDYEKRAMIEGVGLLPPHSHSKNQSAPGPAERVPANWESLLN